MYNKINFESFELKFISKKKLLMTFLFLWYKTSTFYYFILITIEYFVRMKFAAAETLRSKAKKR